jgi:hypothetical protein
MSWKLVFATFISAGLCAACASRTPAHYDSSKAGGPAMINAVLADSIDTRRNKPGDPVNATVVAQSKADGVVIPRNSRLVGEITLVKGASDTDYQSILAMKFDRAVLADGREVPLQAVVRALAVPQSAPEPADPVLSTQAARKRKATRPDVSEWLGGGRRTLYNSATVARPSSRAMQKKLTRSPGAIGGLDPAGLLVAGSSGTFGLPGLSVNERFDTAGSSTLVSAIRHEVRLESGTRMLLVIEDRTAQPGPANSGAMP